MSQLPTPKRFQLDAQPQRDARAVSTQVLELGKDHIVSFAGTSQFTAQGVSACGLAAFNFARIGFRIEQSKSSLTDVLNELSKREVIEEIVAICAGWSSNLHLEVDEIYQLPIFSRSLKLLSTKYGRPRPSHFRSILGTMNNADTSAVVIITRPPEIIACFKFANSNVGPHSSSSDKPIFVVFDSHPRPSHPHGAGLSFSTSIESTARTLNDILPTMDEGIFDSSDFEWQVQLLSNCSAHMYVAKHQRKDHEEAVIQSSLSILALRARASELKRENEELISDNMQLDSQVDHLRAFSRQEQAKARHIVSSFPTSFAGRVIGRSFGLISHALAGPSRTSGASVGSVHQSDTHSRSADAPSTAPVKRIGSAHSSAPPDIAGAKSIFANNPPPVPSQAPPAYDDLDLDSNLTADSDDPWIQTTFVARELQNEFDSEDRRLRQEHTDLAARYMQATFQCSICMDELPEDDVAKVDDCVHMMCRSCLRQFVSSKIQEHRYPIFCPVCTTVKDRKEPCMISRFLIEQLGASEEQFQILTEMELAEFTIQIHCRKCQRPAFVDREDYSEVINIVCPQEDCHHVWCKKCEQSIVVDGPKHSCDGSSELDHLMKEKGWKHCPNCKTPILKETGCHHMMCISPGCNTHFCYVCGGMIVRSALNHEIGQAVAAHFRRCQLFEVPD